MIVVDRAAHDQGRDETTSHRFEEEVEEGVEESGEGTEVNW